MKAAIGFKPRIGRAAMVILGGEPGTPVFIDRREVALLPPGDFAPYHVASELPPARRQASVDRAVATAGAMAEQALREAIARCKAQGDTLVRCGVLVGEPIPQWSTDEIIAVHVRMHQAEGEMFRQALVRAARALDLGPVTLPGKNALEGAANALGMKPAQLAASLGALGKQAGPPWRTHEREAAAVALVALASRAK